jgi:hypothetical protein
MRPTLKSAAAAVFIGGCAAAGIAVASASTPASHPVTPPPVQLTGAGSTVSVEMQHHGRDLHQDLHRGRDAHQGLNGVSGSDDSATPSLAPSTGPGDDSQSNEPVEITSTEPTEDNQSTEPGDDNQSSQPGEDNQSTEPGDDNGTDVPGEDGGDNGGSSDSSGSGDGGSGGGDGGSDG